jgi:hypothetical protein
MPYFSDFYAQGDVVQARSCCEKVLSLKSGFSPTIRAMAYIHLKQGEVEKAIQCLSVLKS